MRRAEIARRHCRGASGSGEIAPRVLSRELKALAALGLIERTEYQVVPPKVEYTLTPVGYSMLPIIDQLSEWGTQYLLREDVLKTDEG